VGSAEFERRVAAGAPTESIAECGRLSGCSTLWESGLALVSRGETTLDELRRVAAEPARVVTEPEPRSSSTALRIAWNVSSKAPRMAALRSELIEAAKALGGHVHIVEIPPGHEDGEAFDATIAGAASPSPLRSASLMVLLAADSLGARHVGLLARDADLVLPCEAHGRLLLASILALLRWRSRE
jgi:hypothetical protein